MFLLFVEESFILKVKNACGGVINGDGQIIMMALITVKRYGTLLMANRDIRMMTNAVTKLLFSYGEFGDMYECRNKS